MGIGHFSLPKASAAGSGDEPFFDFFPVVFVLKVSHRFFIPK
jgi:hypothetical protein